jgi:hypothetical protein
MALERSLTVKLRGRTEAPALGAEGAQFLSARGAKQEAHHGPLQRLLGAQGNVDLTSIRVVRLTVAQSNSNILQDLRGDQTRLYERK